MRKPSPGSSGTSSCESCQKGAFVRSISHDDVRELYQIREALEALAVRLAAPRFERGELQGFETRFRDIRARGAKATPTRCGPSARNSTAWS